MPELIEKSKVVKELEKRGCKVGVDDIIDDKHLDSFWYDGLVLSFEHKDRTFKVYACGEIEIREGKGGLVYDCKERGDGFDFELKDDESLRNIGSNYDDKYYWEHNNWFELHQEGVEDEDTLGFGEVFYSLDELKGFLDYYGVK
jgi:hypothetical protein